MTIAIIGTRGIPNQHGGFEQFAEFFSVYAVKKGHRVVVYSTSDHDFQDNAFNGVQIIHKYNPEKTLGALGQFVYDYHCIKDLKKLKPDVILQLGYTSSSVWGWLLPKNIPVFTNMDGMEWRRQKYNRLTQFLLKKAEKWAVNTSQILIADSQGIKIYLENKYNRKPRFIPYGSKIFNFPETNVIEKYGLKPYTYNMLIARMEPENNIETILESAVTSEKKMTFLVIGSFEKTSFGRKIHRRFSNYRHIKFLGAIYNEKIINNLRYFSNIYCHGHSVGGTNPSLLEAMGSHALIVAHDNVFNRSILENDAFYFKNTKDLTTLFNTINKQDHLSIIQNNLTKIEEQYDWKKINNQYLKLFNKYK